VETGHPATLAAVGAASLQVAADGSDRGCFQLGRRQPGRLIRLRAFEAPPARHNMSSARPSCRCGSRSYRGHVLEQETAQESRRTASAAASPNRLGGEFGLHGHEQRWGQGWAHDRCGMFRRDRPPVVTLAIQQLAGRQ
jgi:hypothetical protein